MSTLSPDQWKILSPHLDKALEMTDEQRSKWLSSLRSENATLAGKIENLLRHHRTLPEKEFPEQWSFRLLGWQCLAGQTVGAYRLKSQIGQGGMSSVWLAESRDGRVQRQVAIKFLNPRWMGGDGERWLEREGSMLARLSHPHIAELIEASVTPTGQPYLVLEYIEGEHIDRYCDMRTFNVAARIQLMLKLMVAISHAHHKLIVHCDIKPPNVLVRDDREVKLLDFGIAKLLADDTRTNHTASLAIGHLRPMTPGFAAPEQLQGNAVTTSTDVYALGVLLYVLLTGQHPYGRGPQSAVDLLKAVISAEPTCLSDAVATDPVIGVTVAARRAVTPGKLRELLREDLDAIVTKALKKAPDERYSSVAAFADDLLTYLRNRSVRATSRTLTFRAARIPA
jgi:eukaryotic-like serine/threonine-protein kinase